jgi:hypothetical protein
MSKWRLLAAFMAIAFVVPLAVSGQKAKPPKPPGYAPCTFELEVNSGQSIVEVGRDVGTYGPMDQALYVHESLLPPLDTTDFPDAVADLRAGGADEGGFYGPYYGQIRVLDDRIDYWFDTRAGCAQDISADFACRFRLVVADGTPVYEKIGKTRTLVRIAFEDGRTLLDYRWCDPTTNPDCYVTLYGCYDDRDCPGVPPGGEGYVLATFEVRF